MEDDLESNLLANDKQEGTSDLFEMQHWDLPSIQNGILSVAVSEKYIFILTRGNDMIRWSIGDSESLRQSYPIEVSEQNINEKVTKIFCDKTGNHCFIKYFGKVFYFRDTGKQAKIVEVQGLRNLEITAMAFDDNVRDARRTGEILFAYNDKSGKRAIRKYILEVEENGKIKDNSEDLIFMDLEERIDGLYLYNDKKKTTKYVIAVTKTKLMQFQGSPTYQKVFEKYQDKASLLSATKIFPSPGKNSIKRSMLSMLLIGDTPSSFGWMADPGFCYGNYGGQISQVLNYVVFPYVKIKKDGKKDSEDIPIAACHTENHVYVLYQDCFTVISKITSNIIHTQYFNNETYNDMLYSNYNGSIWLYSTRNIYQISLDKENDNIWQDYLEKGDYNKALEVCQSADLPHLKKISKLCGNDLFEKGDYINSALKYADSDEKFEEVCLKFLLKNENEALKYYLQTIDYNRLVEGDLTQKHLIATWYIEILLNDLNSTTEPDKIKNKKNDLKQWMNEKNQYLDKDTIYQLLQHYGRVEEFLEFAEIKNDYETIILHYINEKDIKTALDKLQDFLTRDVEEKREDLKNIFIRYSHSFMKYEPETTINILTTKFQSDIDPSKIISAIMSTEKSHYDKVLKYLRSLVKKSNMKEKNIHNLYIFYLSKNDELKDELIEYLKKPLDRENSKNQEVLFELDYAKKLFSNNAPALALVLALMGKYTEAVKKALEKDKGDINIAKFIAKHVQDHKIQKSLWLDIFSSNNNNNFKSALEIMEESVVLKIEDVLPHIMDNIKIEEFKSQISNCINVYEKNIQDLKTDINEYNKTAENIKSDIYKVKKRSMEIQYRQCKCEICQCNIKDDNIYLFPCGHMFDWKCIFEAMTNYSIYIESLKPKIEDMKKIRREIDDLEKRKNDGGRPVEVGKAEGKGGLLGNILNFAGDKGKKVDKISLSADESKRLEELKEQFSEYLSEECVLCGDYMVLSTQCQFKGDTTAWMIE